MFAALWQLFWCICASTFSFLLWKHFTLFILVLLFIFPKLKEQKTEFCFFSVYFFPFWCSRALLHHCACQDCAVDHLVEGGRRPTLKFKNNQVIFFHHFMQAIQSKSFYSRFQWSCQRCFSVFHWWKSTFVESDAAVLPKGGSSFINKVSAQVMSLSTPCVIASLFSFIPQLKKHVIIVNTCKGSTRCNNACRAPRVINTAYFINTSIQSVLVHNRWVAGHLLKTRYNNGICAPLTLCW